MNWFWCAFISMVSWGIADLFYKKGSTEGDRYSHLKIAIWVGIIMGVGSTILLFLSDTDLSIKSIFKKALIYSPASLSYIISMVIGYAGLRYLELSIASPLQNASGAFSMILIAAWLLGRGEIRSITEEYSVTSMVGTALVIIGAIWLAVAERKISQREESERENRQNKKYRIGALALLFPLLYCLFDTIGTSFDGILLTGSLEMDLSETEVLILYGYTFLAISVILYIFLWIKQKKPYNPFRKSQLPKVSAALFEELGQIFYVYAMAKNPVPAAPMIGSYCALSVIFSRLFLGENPETGEKIAVAIVVLGIILLGLSDGGFNFLSITETIAE